MAINRYSLVVSVPGHSNTTLTVRPQAEPATLGDYVLYSDHLADREAYAKQKVEEAIHEIEVKLRPLISDMMGAGATMEKYGRRSELTELTNMGKATTKGAEYLSSVLKESR